jgi:hypothetical protein
MQAIIERKRILEALPKGDISLRAPTAMKVSDRRKVEAEVGFHVPAKKPPASGTTEVKDTLFVSSEMIATLDSPAFEIKAITPEQQPIVEGYPTVWAWNVEAKESGEQLLTATVYALVGEKSDRMRIANKELKISVSVREQTWGEWLEAAGKEIGTVQGIFVALGAVATSFLACLAWLGISLGRRRNKTTSSVAFTELSPPAT